MLTHGAPAGSTTEWLCHWRQSRAPPGSRPARHTCPARPLSWEQSDEARSETPTAADGFYRYGTVEAHGLSGGGRMKAFLMYPGQDFDLGRELPANTAGLTQFDLVCTGGSSP